MRQHHLLSNRVDALKVTATKIYYATDDAAAVIVSHAILETMLFLSLRAFTKAPEHLDKLNLRFSQLVPLVRAFKGPIDVDPWLWKTIGEVQRIRNILAHQIDVTDLPEMKRALVASVGDNMKVDLDGVPHDKEFRAFLIILCDVVHQLCWHEGVYGGHTKPAPKEV